MRGGNDNWRLLRPSLKLSSRNDDCMGCIAEQCNQLLNEDEGAIFIEALQQILDCPITYREDIRLIPF